MARQKKDGDYYAADYFSHDADMRNDIKVKALRRKFGIAGYAVWNFLLEVLADKDNFELEFGELDQELLAADFDVTVEDLKDIVDYSVKIGLLKQDGIRIYSETMKRRFAEVFDLWEQRRQRRQRRIEANRENGRKGGNPNFKKGQPNPYYQTTESVMEDNPNITQHTEKTTEDNPKLNETKQDETKRPIKEKSPKGEKKAATTSRFVPPTIEDVRAYIQQMNFRHVDPERFIDYYTSNGWKVGRNPMKNWQATVRNWENKNKPQTTTSQNGEITLGVGEFINGKGIRTYGTSGTAVPPSAPPRPSDAHWWNTASNQWEKIL